MVAANGTVFSPFSTNQDVLSFVSYQTANLIFIFSGNHAVASLLFPQNLAVVVSRYVFDFPPLK